MAETTVVLVGTLDTKGREYAFLRERLQAAGVATILVDAGIMGPPLVEPDVGREEVAAAAGADVEALRAAGDRGQAVLAMARGATAVDRRACTPRGVATACSPPAARATRRSPPRRCRRSRSACPS